jgi:hypothetical protein
VGRPTSATLAAVLALGVVGVGTTTAWATGPSVGGGSGSYTEQAAPTLVGSDVTVSGGGSYAGQYLTFAVDGAASSESLSVQSVGSPVTTNGVVSVVGSSVYLGNGSGADIIGSVDGTSDGQSGRTLRVDFTSAFTNSSFESGTLTGWTAINQRIDLGVTAIAGTTTVDTSTYSGTSAPDQDDNAPSTLGSLTTTVQTTEKSDGTYALRLQSSGMTTAQGYDVVHGPAVYSSPFEAAAGDTIYFDWRAFMGSDNYHVFGYLLDQSGNQLEVLDATGAGTTSWTTKATVIPSSGTYRFVFVSGTYDASGGQAAGASLIIDNVRVYGTKATDDVVQQIARLLQYANSSDNPAASRTVTVTAVSTTGTGTGSVTLAVTGVDDPPSFGGVGTATFTNTEGAQTYAPVTGTLTVTDPEGDTPAFALVGGVADAQTVGGTAYTHSVTGTYATVRLNATTGAYLVEPNAAAIDARLTDDAEPFAVTVATNALGATSAIPVAVSVPPSAPGAPTGMGATPGAGQLALGWTAPTWLGGSAITHYVVETSLDGSSWTTALTTADATPSATVTGLTNGTPVHVRVRAVNATGTSAPAASTSAVPVTTPGAPTALAGTPGDDAASLTWTAPADEGGTPVTGYRVETSPDGVTWATAVADTGSSTAVAVVWGLRNGTGTWLRVSAINAVGVGAPSSAVRVVPRTTPGAPTGVGLAPGNGTLAVTWTAPTSNGGDAISAYRVETSTDGTTWTLAATAAASPAVLTGLANGTPVQVRVRAVNAAGAGAAATPRSATPRTVPGAPMVQGVDAGNRTLSVRFTPPTSDGGSAVLTVQYSLDGGVTWNARRAGSTASPLVIGGLENGTAATVLLRAVNEAGAGAPSESVTDTPTMGPVPVQGLDGPRIPELRPGRSTLLVDGEPQVVDRSVEKGAVLLTGDGFTVSLQPVTPQGAPADVNASSGRFQVAEGGAVRVAGSGFRPGSTVDVWMFSTPHLLGVATVAADGTFVASFPLPAGAVVGEHTVQLNGVGTDDAVRTLAAGIEVQAAPVAPRLAATGAEPQSLLLLQVLVLTSGAALLALRRRLVARAAVR